MSTISRMPFELPGHDLMSRVAAVGEASGGMLPGKIGELTHAVADAIRATDIGVRRYYMSRASAMALTLWTAIQGHPGARDLRIALFRLYLALSGGHEPQTSAALSLAA